jgi:hypothetical protein
VNGLLVFESLLLRLNISIGTGIGTLIQACSFGTGFSLQAMNATL